MSNWVGLIIAGSIVWSGTWIGRCILHFHNRQWLDAFSGAVARIGEEIYQLRDRGIRGVHSRDDN